MNINKHVYSLIIIRVYLYVFVILKYLITLLQGRHILIIFLLLIETTVSAQQFSAEKAIDHIRELLLLGPRVTGYSGHYNARKLIINVLKKNNNNISEQCFNYHSESKKKYQFCNIIARFSPENQQRIVLGTHYDSKQFDDQSKNVKSQLVVPGANDSASGVALLLVMSEILRNISVEIGLGIDLVFFDGEEGVQHGENDVWFPIGSSYFVSNIDMYFQQKPLLVIVFDMICDKNLQIYQEKSSLDNSFTWVEKFWYSAEKLGYTSFIKQHKMRIFDDHSPFILNNIPAFLVIDYDYKFWHTYQDTLDKCSQKSLEEVGNTLIYFLKNLTASIELK
ncbi:MAG: M28 family peptidase [Methylococcales bacterium]|nr:M28 family peptidase [Methylococcales bacterium]MBT7410229.1 M28 family peptidase [Methylococcales bacterium]